MARSYIMWPINNVVSLHTAYSCQSRLSRTAQDFGSAIKRGKVFEVHHLGDFVKGIILGEDCEPSIRFIVSFVVIPGVTPVWIGPSKPIEHQRSWDDLMLAMLPGVSLTT